MSVGLWIKLESRKWLKIFHMPSPRYVSLYILEILTRSGEMHGMDLLRTFRMASQTLSMNATQSTMKMIKI